MNIFVGNLSDAVTEGDLERAFEKHGEVLSATVIKERGTGTPKGYGFVEMYNQEEALKAIAAMNGALIKGQAIVVNEARPKEKDGKGTGGKSTGKTGR